MAKDLGTYFVKVELQDGRGWYQSWETGWRYTNGMDSWSPLTATPIPPAWEDDTDVMSSISYQFLEGNYACDCNRRLFLDYAAQKKGFEQYPCGEQLTLKRLTAIRPDRSEVVLFDCNSETESEVRA